MFYFAPIRFGVHDLSISELATTLTELMAMAAPAMAGLNRPLAASGIPMTL
jgi:hypothetical protein